MNRLPVSLLTCLSLVFSFGMLIAEEEMAPPRDSGPWQGLIMIAIAFAFFYFILWRPEQKRRREIESKRSSLQQGDRVTAMGILGTVIRVKDHSVILKMVDGSKIEVLKGAISDVATGPAPDEKEES